MQDVTLFDFLRYYNYSYKRLARRKAITRAQVLQYFPYYSADLTLDSYKDYCRVKITLHYPFLKVNELLIIKGIKYKTFV